jgi:hypothetical protein
MPIIWRMIGWLWPPASSKTSARIGESETGVYNRERRVEGGRQWQSVASVSLVNHTCSADAGCFGVGCFWVIALRRMGQLR